MMLQPLPTPQPNKENVQTTMQAYLDTLHAKTEESQISPHSYSRISLY